MNKLGEFFLGVVTGVVACQLWEIITRWHLHRVAVRLQGVWTAHEMLDGRTIDRDRLMANAWPTVMKAKRFPFSAGSHILDISAADTSTTTGRRPHSGHLVIDRVAPSRATRVVFYGDSDEAFEQEHSYQRGWAHIACSSHARLQQACTV